MLRRFLIPAIAAATLLLSLPTALARPGAIQTRDGKRHEGQLSFTNGAVQVSNSTDVVAIPQADIARLSFDPEKITPTPPSDGDGFGLLGYYFATTNVLGPVQARLDPAIDFNWGAAEPMDGIGKDYFAVIWMGYVQAPASGDYTFFLKADDNARLQIGSDLVIESASREEGADVSGKLALEAGERYPVTLLYRDNFGSAHVRLAWSGPDLPKSIVPSHRLFPASFLAEHAADIQFRHGLLATVYKDESFIGHTSTRVDPTIDCKVPGNVVRWSGQLRADHSETYTFYVAADGPVRLSINGRPLIDKWTLQGMAELRASIPLTAGEPYDLQLESGPGVRRLMWSSPSQPKAVIPENHLLPFKHVSMPPGAEQVLRPGVLLRNGSFIACQVESLDADTLQCSRLLQGKVAAREVARIICQPLPRALTGRVSSGRAGLLLANGDFVEGAFTGMDATQVTISSILFGLRSYNTKQVLAIILREADNQAPPCEIQLRDQSVLFATDIELQSEGLVLKDKLLAGMTLPENEILGIRLGR